MDYSKSFDKKESEPSGSPGKEKEASVEEEHDSLTLDDLQYLVETLQVLKVNPKVNLKVSVTFQFGDDAYVLEDLNDPFYKVGGTDPD